MEGDHDICDLGKLVAESMGKKPAHVEAMCKSIYGEGAKQVEGEKGEKGAEKDEEGSKTGGEHTPDTEEEDAEEGRPTIVISSMFRCVMWCF